MSFFKNKLRRGHSMRVPSEERPPRLKLSSLLSFGSSRRAGRPLSPISPLSTGGMREAAASAGATLRGGLRRRGSTYRHLDAAAEPPQEWDPAPPEFVLQNDFAYYSRDWNHYETDRVWSETRRAREANGAGRLSRSATCGPHHNRHTPRARRQDYDDVVLSRSRSTREVDHTGWGSNNPFNPTIPARRPVPPPKPVWVQFEDEWSSASSSGSS